MALRKLEFGFLNVQALIKLGVEYPKGIVHMSSVVYCNTSSASFPREMYQIHIRYNEWDY